MSWTGLKKAINRAGNQVLVRTGQVEQSIDKEFEFEEKRYREMEKTSGKLHKELRSYLELLRIVTQAQTNVGEVLSEYYGSGKHITDNDNNVTGNNDTSDFAVQYFQTVKKIGEETLLDLEGPYNQTILNPLSRFNSYYPEINSAIKKRARKQLDYDLLKSKVNKMIDKEQQNVQEHRERDPRLPELNKQLQAAEETYTKLNDQLKQELPNFVNLRIPFLDPSFSLFVKLQMKFFDDNYQQLSQLELRLDAKSREEYIKGDLDKKIDLALVKMKELNIAV